MTYIQCACIFRPKYNQFLFAALLEDFWEFVDLLVVCCMSDSDVINLCFLSFRVDRMVGGGIVTMLET